jgi:inorganic triphosphatase YgiF
VCELELELKAGRPEALFGLARRLAESERLQLSFKSKAERGFGLLQAAAPAAVFSRSPDLEPGMTVAEAFVAVGGEGLRQLTANAAVLRALRRPEALHQTRVAIRRLRTGFKLFEPAVRDKDYERLNGELKWLAGELDQARDLDVMIADSFRPAADLFQGQDGLAALGKRMHGARGKAYDRAMAALDSSRFFALTLDLAFWLGGGAWRDPADPLHASRAGASIGAFAGEQLDRLRRQTKRRGKGLERLSPELRHKLRIRIKRLRYAVEFFSGLYATAGRDRFAKALKRLQDALGELNDLEVARGQGLALAEAGGRASGDTAAEGARQAFAAGLMIGARARSQAPLLKEAAKLHDKLMDAEPFWRG